MTNILRDSGRGEAMNKPTAETQKKCLGCDDFARKDHEFCSDDCERDYREEWEWLKVIWGCED
jgi:hypothetical protein